MIGLASVISRHAAESRHRLALHARLEALPTMCAQLCACCTLCNGMARKLHAVGRQGLHRSQCIDEGSKVFQLLMSCFACAVLVMPYATSILFTADCYKVALELR